MCLLRHLDSHWKIPQRATYTYPRPGNCQLVCHTSAMVVRWALTSLQYWRPVGNWSALSCRPSYDGFDGRQSMANWSLLDRRLIADHHQLPQTSLWQMLPYHWFRSSTGCTTSGRPKSVWLYNCFGDHGRRWSQVVGDDFGHRWSPTGRPLSVTGSLVAALWPIWLNKICAF